MKKNIVLFLFIISSFSVYSQIKVGIRIAPLISNDRVSADNGVTGYVDGKPALSFSAGAFGDYFFRENYALHTGLRYTVKKFQNSGNNSTGYVNLQYIQLPLALKLLTDEVTDGLNLYFQFGGTLDFRMTEKYKDMTTTPTSKVTRPFDAGMLLAAGVEKNFGGNTVVFGGLEYNRGFLDISKNTTIQSKSTLISLEMGLKF
jgi:hypothetical protein